MQNKAHEAEGTFIFKADRPFKFATGVTFAFYIAASAMHNLFSRCGVLSNFKLNFVHPVSNIIMEFVRAGVADWSTSELKVNRNLVVRRDG